MQMHITRASHNMNAGVALVAHHHGLGSRKMFLPFRSVRGMSRLRTAAVLSILGLLPAGDLHAQGTWTGAGGATWNTTATNWSGVTGTPWDATNGLTGIATFDGANTPSVSGTVYVNQINKSATAGNTVISNGSGTIILAGSNPTITNNSTAALNIAPILSGASGVTVTLGAGAGTAGGVTFSGNNTYSGTTTINGANNGLTVTNNGALGTSSALVNANAILKVSTGALSNAITINGGASNGAIQTFTSSTLSGLITVASNAIIGNRAGGSTLNLTGGIAASGQTLTLGGVGGSSSTIISTNVVNLGSGGTFRASAQPVTVNIGGNTWGTTLVDWGGAINLGATDALATASILQMGSSGGGETATVDLNGFSQTVAGLRSFTGSGTASASGTRIVTNTGSAATLTVNNTTAYTYDGQINGAIALTKGGASALTIAGSNSYTGATTVSGSGSVLGISNANALGATSGITTVGNRAELRLSGGISVAEPITLNGFGAVRGSLAALTNTSGTNTVSGLITLGTEASENWIRSNVGTLNLTGGVTSPNRSLSLAGAGGLNVTTNAINLGTGDLAVFDQTGSSPVSIGVAGNAMTYMTIWYGGRVRTDVANAFSSSVGLNMGSPDNSNGTLDLNGNSQTFGSLESAGNGTVVITSASAATLSVNQTANRTYAGTITGAVSLTKGGASALTLTGSNTFTGATDVNAGTLAVNGSIASAVNVANAAILGGAGTINGLVTVAGGGILAPGNSPGTLTMTSGLSLADSSVLNFEFSATDTTVGGGINDLVVVTGNFLLDGVLNVAGTGDFSTVADNTKWRLFNYSGGTFTDGVLTLGTMPSVGASGKYFQIDTATAGQVNLVIVPEPGAIVLAGVGIAAAAWAIRRRTA